MIATEARTYTLAEYMVVRDRVEVPVELLRGAIYPKEGNAPLPDWVVEEILRPDFNPKILKYEFPMATSRHAEIIRNLNYALIKNLDEDQFLVYSQDPKIYIALTGSYRLPDITVAPTQESQVFEADSLCNPAIVMEVLSPSNTGVVFMDKIYDYKSIPSLQEYWLVGQDAPLLERFVRHSEEEWLSRSFDQRQTEITFPSIGISLPLDTVYRGVFDAK